MIFDDFCAFVRGLKGSIWWFPTMRYDIYIYIGFMTTRASFLIRIYPIVKIHKECGGIT